MNLLPDNFVFCNCFRRQHCSIALPEAVEHSPPTLKDAIAAIESRLDEPGG